MSRDPQRSLAAVATATLLLEAVVLLLALLGLYGLHHHLRALPGGCIGALVVASCLIAFLQRRAAGIVAAFVLQLAVIAAGVWLWPLFALGLAYAALEAGYVRLRRGLPARVGRPAP